jgi:putative copper export protein
MKNIIIFFSYVLLLVMILLDIGLLLEYFNVEGMLKGLNIYKYGRRLLVRFMLVMFVLSIPILIFYFALLFFPFDRKAKKSFVLIILNCLFILWYILFVVQKNII